MLDGLEKSNTQIEKVLNRLHSPLPTMIKRNTQLASGEDIATVKLCDRDYRNLQLKRVTDKNAIIEDTRGKKREERKKNTLSYNDNASTAMYITVLRAKTGCRTRLIKSTRVPRVY
ncbi:hypothetical protein RRG08_053340 [Elysia crispata]|uniref:Uncharacterized protein n=1 Tax=Elysia crispata TaxID=231223 RepID=A0AAE1DJ11_9GAST|nr:hypothetical protein RRG08_053340 [Elysia crispata]